MKTPKQIYDKAQDRAKNRSLFTSCTHQEYVNMLTKLLLDEIGEHKKEIEQLKQKLEEHIDCKT